jgi:glycosyltransferase involved in cell wall biosynthesis
VVIPTRCRWEVLEGTLSALVEQELDELEAEVIVVDNWSADGSWERLEAAAGGDWPFALRALRERTRGAGAARNAGIVAARGNLVLFLGDDCRPAVGRLVAGHHSAHEERGGGLGIVGHISWDPEIERTRVMDWLERSGKMNDFGPRPQEPAGAHVLFTGNVSLPREALLEAGGFDERFQGYGWEDYELALRLADGGLRIEYLPELAVHHSHVYRFADSIDRMRAMGRTGELLNRIQGHRTPPPAPLPLGPKGAAGRALAPLACRLAPPSLLPPRAADAWLKVSHWCALASGYGEPRLPADSALRGGARLLRTPERPAVSVIVPYFGDAAGAARALEALGPLHLREGDELIVVDNTGADVVPNIGEAKVVRAPERRSAYYARNAGVEAASNEWLLFTDADCLPPERLLDAYFDPPPPPGVGAVSGAVVGASWQPGVLARYARSRSHLAQSAHFRHPYRAMGITANLLVRRAAWEAVGGFYEEIRSGGDADFSWRLQEAGWALGYSELPAIEHVHRDTLGGLIRQATSYAAGRAWANRHHPEASLRPKATRRLLRCAVGIAGWSVTLRPGRALFKAIDAVVILSEAVGWWISNAPRAEAKAPAPGALAMTLVADRFPELSETFVLGEAQALRAAGHRIRIEAADRSARPNREGAAGLPVEYLEDYGFARRGLDLLWLIVRHPLASTRDVLTRRRYAREEVPRNLRALAPRARRMARAGDAHLHAHFAAGAALDALRLGGLLGLPYSLTAHAYDIFQTPANLRAKLTEASFAVGESAYATRYLREVAGRAHESRIHYLAAGVDLRRFRRARPYPGRGRVVAVGRLIEKKGFAHLIDAVAKLGADGGLDEVLIVGEGPLRPALEGRIAEHGLERRVRLLGAREHAQVRDLLETADLLAMPCVVAADGDRDSMPNVVYEALAMEVPVVASDEVGLPEVVRPEWGRVAAPGDAASLAAAIGDLLNLEPEDRAAMGRAGRAFVEREHDVNRQAQRLAELVAAAGGGSPRRAGGLQDWRAVADRAADGGAEFDQVVD